jgi:hypothetical protein
MHGCLGLLGLIIGLSVLTGGHAVAPGANTTAVGGIVLAGGVALLAVGAWQEVAGRREARLEREAAISQVERLARLREEGVLTEAEFTEQKRQILGGGPDAGADQCQG